MKGKAVTPMEKKFVAHYCVHFNGTAAVKHAGFKTEWPGQYAVQLLTKRSIQDQVNRVIEGLGELHFRLADEVTSSLRAMSHADRTAILNVDGSLKDPKDWPEECKLLLAGIDIEERTVGEGRDETIIRTKKVKLEAPKGILDSLARITGQWIERSQFLNRHGEPTDPPGSEEVDVKELARRIAFTLVLAGRQETPKAKPKTG